MLMKRPGRTVVRVVDGDTLKVVRSVRAGHVKSQYVRLAEKRGFQVAQGVPGFVAGRVSGE